MPEPIYIDDIVASLEHPNEPPPRRSFTTKESGDYGWKCGKCGQWLLRARPEGGGSVLIEVDMDALIAAHVCAVVEGQ